MENQKGFKISQYACAVLLIVSSIVMVAYQVVHIDDVAITSDLVCRKFATEKQIKFVEVNSM